MNTSQAKNNIHITDYLQSMSIYPIKQNEIKALYKSPFREENKASFEVSKPRNTFIDWGSGERGTVVDLVMKIHNTNISGALQILENTNGNIQNRTPFSFNKQSFKESPGIKEGTISHIKTVSLVKYLERRKISKRIWSNCSHLFEYSYLNPKNPTSGRKFHNLAWLNDRGGYELNNQTFKSCLKNKEITTIPGNKTELNIFEGFFDYLSALTFFNIDKFHGTTIVLNSVVLVEKHINTIVSFDIINSYLDNDKAGIQAFETINNNCKHLVNKSKAIYPNHKDFNDFLISNTI